MKRAYLAWGCGNWKQVHVCLRGGVLQASPAFQKNRAIDLNYRSALSAGKVEADRLVVWPTLLCCTAQQERIFTNMEHAPRQLARASRIDPMV
jgi:hypothetical protein